MRYTSSVKLLGFPLVDIAIGVPEPAGRAVARGWIAVGDIAFGAVALGGIAIGVVGLGGLSVGAFAIAGVSVGAWSIGGVALGAFSFGGMSLAAVAATGGLAAAGQYAIGGVAIAAHANDEVSRSSFASGDFFRYTGSLAPYLQWLIAVVVGLAALVWALGSRKGLDGSHRDPG